MHFSTKEGVGEKYGNQMVARQCFMIYAKMNQSVKTMPVDISDALDEVKKIQGELVEKLEALWEMIQRKWFRSV